MTVDAMISGSRSSLESGRCDEGVGRVGMRASRRSRAALASTASLVQRTRQAASMLRDDGGRVVLGKVLREASVRMLDGTLTMDLGLPRDQILAPPATHGTPQGVPAGSRLLINFVVSPPAVGSGGTTTSFRVVRLLEQRGHQCRVYINYGPFKRQLDRDRAIIEEHFSPLRASVEDVADGMSAADAIFATSWPTAYVVRQSQAAGVRFYLVQDFEPMLYAASSRGALAEQTYRFGFHGITAGQWLAAKLPSDYGMQCDAFDLGVDLACYRLENRCARAGVVFYARPNTARRGFEIGMLALELFAAQHPEIEIHLVGQRIRTRGARFPFVSHGVLTPMELAALYNRCAAGLVLSLTNLSLLPAELLATGCIPIVNDAEHNRMSCSNPHVRFTPALPLELAKSLCEIVEAPDLLAKSAAAAGSAHVLSWEHVGAQIEAGIVRGLRTAGTSQELPYEFCRPGGPGIGMEM